MDLENAEEILQILERYTKQKSKTIPDELSGYLTHVALTGDSVYSWSKVQYFFREKLAHVLKDFHDTTPRTEDLPVSRNVDTFNYDTMKTTLLERFDLFNSAPFTIQRLSELLNEPKKHYCRLDKFMRALEKNILVVSTVEPGHRPMGSENGDSINGDPLMDINVDIEMDKEPSSSCVTTIEKKSVDDRSESAMDITSTHNKTEQGTSEQSDELISDDANTNGHQEDELNDTIEDPKEDEDIVDSTDNTEISNDETIAAEANEIEPTEVTEKVNSPEVSAEVNQPVSEASQVTSIADQAKETSDMIKDASTEKEAPELKTENNLALTSKQEDTNEIIDNKGSENVGECVKHSLDHDDDDEASQPTASKLIKIDDEALTAVRPVVVADSEQAVAVADSEQVVAVADEQAVAVADSEQAVAVVGSERAVAANDEEAPSVETVPEDQQTSEVKEISTEPVLEADTETIQTAVVEQPLVEEQQISHESSDVAKPLLSDSRSDIDATTEIPVDTEPVQTDTIDDNNDTSTDNAISPLASTVSNNDLDTLEDDEDELIEPIISDIDRNIVEFATDVEMTPTADNPEQMAVEDQALVSPLTNLDSAMDATQNIPSTNDEQMEVLESNSMDEDL